MNANDIVGIFDTCWHVVLKAKHASDLLKSAAGDALGHIVLVVFSRANSATTATTTTAMTYQSPPSSRITPSAPATTTEQQPAIVTILSRLTTYLNPILHPTSINVLSLTLLNIALETCTVTTFTSLLTTTAYSQKLLSILQNDLCKNLLCLSTTEDLVLFTLTLRVIFNLFHGVNKDFLKVQLEVFLTSVHLRILVPNTAPISSNTKGLSSIPTKQILEQQQREIALESLVEFCHEPALMMDIYLNYDCDLNCSNLFESICRTLSFCAIGVANAGDSLNVSLHGSTATTTTLGAENHSNGDMDDEEYTQQQPLNSLNRLALEGILAVIDSIARRCIIRPGTSINGTAIATARMDVKEEDDNYIYGTDDDIVTYAKSSTHKQTNQKNTWQKIRLLERRELSLCSSTTYGEEEEVDVEYTHDMDSLSSVDCDYSYESGENDLSLMKNDTCTIPQKQKDHSQHQHRHHNLWHSPRSRERTTHILRIRKQRKQKAYQIAREFNRSSSDKEWVSTGERLHVLPTPATPASVASFLYHSHTLLDKTKIGLYVSKGPDTKYPFHAQVRQEFVNLFDFRTMSFSGALRYFLKRFRLPGEAQCIDRLMEAFANRLYFQHSLEVGDEGEKEEEERNEKEEEEVSKKEEGNVNAETLFKKEDENQTKEGNGERERNNGYISSSANLMQGRQKHEQGEGTPSPSLETTVINDEDDSSSGGGAVTAATVKKYSSSPFHNADAVFILSFSTIMLNTDLHNPNMKDEKRMTVEEFIRNNRGINNGENLPKSFLNDLYYQIKHKEIQVQGNTADHVLSEVVATTATGSGGSGGNDYECSGASEVKKTGEMRERMGPVSTSDAAWDGILSKSSEVETAFFTPSDKARKTFFRAGLHERDMFTSIISMSIQCISSTFVRSWDDLLVVKALRGFRQMAEICIYFDLEERLNEILETLLGYGRDYVLSTIMLDRKVYNDEEENNDNKKGGEDSDDEEALFDEIPYSVLSRDATSSFASISSPSHFRDTVTGSASHRGLLSLNCALTLIRQHPFRIREAWPALVGCIFALRDADALPVGLADLDDFADSQGVVLPASPFSRLSQRRVNAYIASILTVEESDEGSWFWRSLFGGQKRKLLSLTHDGSIAGGSGNLSPSRKQSFKQAPPLTEALLFVVKTAELDRILIRSRDLPLATQIIHVLLETMDPTSYDFLPFSYSSTYQRNAGSEVSDNDEAAQEDLLFEHNAVFALELAARALLSNQQHAPTLYPMFLSKFQSILVPERSDAQQQQHESLSPCPKGTKKESSSQRHLSSAALRAPYIMERVVVTILRSCIHLYDAPGMRQYLKSSLKLLADLPMEFVKHISDRLACGMAIILRGRFCQLETSDEWNLVGDLLDRAAHFRSGRRFVFDGIASSVDYALCPLPEVGSKSTDVLDAVENDGVKVTYEGGYILVKLLTYFVFGKYDGDISMRRLAMPRLEKMYWILFHMSVDHSAVDEHNKPMEGMVPDEELWQIVASAFHECSLSDNLDTSRQGVGCMRRFLLTTKPDSMSDVGWITILYSLSSRRPSVEADDVRIEYCDLLGKILLLLLPKLSQRSENWDELTAIVKQTAEVFGENLRAGRRGNVSPLFESTVQTVTNMCNVMSLSEFDGGAGFSQWAGEALLAELEKVGASGGAVMMIAAITR
uniref:SEC7 domain-containing protein n=1 Tax=Ditylum brightwellii TaxID=49249 RepID=A0A7S1ZBD9_9STRA